MSGADHSEAAAVQCRFVRGRNALLCHADFGPVFVDLYLHLGGLGVVLDGGADGKLKLLLAAVTLHAASRPRAETIAWTLHLEKERLNLFAVAENPTGRVIGQVFNRMVKSLPGNVLHAETALAAGSQRRSSVDFTGGGVADAVAAFFAQSEQRGARFFELGGDRFALLTAQPDCDEAWLASVAASEVEALTELSVPPLETRLYRFECGCTPARIAQAIGPAVRGDIDGFFGDEQHVRVTCPRCGQVHEIGRGEFGGS